MNHLPIAETAAAALFAAIFLGGEQLQRLVAHRKGTWASAAAGIAIAYVFVHILPELAEGQAFFNKVNHRHLPFLEHHVYVSALLGFLVYYGMDVRRSSTEGAGQSEKEVDRKEYHLRVAAYAGYAGLASYLLFRSAADLRAVVFYGFAMAMHFLAMDKDLRHDLGARYEQRGKWILAGAVVAGWLLGLVIPLPRAFLATALGFLAGAVVINSAIAELPGVRQGQFWRFCVGAVGYALVLLLA
jgi:hypothetical protein